jgi:hypothetical protein
MFHGQPPISGVQIKLPEVQIFLSGGVDWALHRDGTDPGAGCYRRVARNATATKAWDSGEATGQLLWINLLSAVVGASALLPLVVNEATKGHGQRQLSPPQVADAAPRREPR